MFQPAADCTLKRLHLHRILPFRDEEVPKLIRVRDLSDTYLEHEGTYGGKGEILDIAVG